MKPTFLLCLLLLLGGSLQAMAQGPTKGAPGFDLRKKKVSEDTKKKALEAATSLYKAVPDDVKTKAKELLTSPEAGEARQKALQAAQNAMRGGSAPAEGIPAAPATATGAEPPATPAAAAPMASPATPVAEAPPPPPSGPQPKPLQPLNLDEAPTATKGQIVITAQKSAFFDANKGYGIYVGDVKARSAQMYIECEELELFMTRQEGGMLGGPKKAPSKDADIVAAKKDDDNMPIEKADARGPMVTVEKISDQGELQVGHCKHLIFDGKTGISTLMDWPQVQAGNKLHKATEAGCIMIIDRKGMLTTTGGHQTIILQGEDATPKSRAGMAPAPQ
ncbi:MAG TPA: hypothetical protein VGE39_01810 [Prosthecobacter sp.]